LKRMSIRVLFDEDIPPDRIYAGNFTISHRSRSLPVRLLARCG
jgi:hypothetical protein